MAAKSEFSKNHKKIRFVDLSEISPERYITGHKETIESLKNRVNFPDSCPLRLETTAKTVNDQTCPTLDQTRSRSVKKKNIEN